MSDAKTGTLIPYLNEMFRYQAWMAMGKIANPVSGEVERDLGVARSMIDLLDELQVKTDGNRSEDETRLLQATLTDLRLNFMEEKKRPEAEDASAEDASKEEETPEPVESGEEADAT